MYMHAHACTCARHCHHLALTLCGNRWRAVRARMLGPRKAAPSTDVDNEVCEGFGDDASEGAGEDEDEDHFDGFGDGGSEASSSGQANSSEIGFVASPGGTTGAF